MGSLFSLFSAPRIAADWDPDVPAIAASGLGMKGSRPVFEDVGAHVPTGGLLVITGPEGSGKTSLLLALAGRMRVDAGSAQIYGVDLRRSARTVRGLVSIGHVSGLTDFDNNLRVRQLVAERLIMLQPWYKPWVSKKRVNEVLERLARIYHEVQGAYSAVAGSDPSPFPTGAYADELTDLEQFLLAAALASLARSPVLALDNIDLLRRREDRECAWLALLVGRTIFESPQVGQPTLIVTCETHEELDEVLADRVALDHAHVADPASEIVHLGLRPRS